MKRLLTASLLVLSLFGGSPVSAQDAGSPEALIKDTTEKVLGTLEQNKTEVQKNPQAVLPLVRDIVLPNFDFERMAKLVLARNWTNASADQRQRFTNEFRELLIRTYGTSLSQYSGQKVTYLHNPPSPQPERATVRTQIIQPDGPPVPVTYELYKGAQGWKVFDVVIDGVSLVQNYRSTFNSQIQQGGLDSLIKQLAEKNQSKG